MSLVRFVYLVVIFFMFDFFFFLSFYNLKEYPKLVFFQPGYSLKKKKKKEKTEKRKKKKDKKENRNDKKKIRSKKKIEIIKNILYTDQIKTILLQVVTRWIPMGGIIVFAVIYRKPSYYVISSPTTTCTRYDFDVLIAAMVPSIVRTFINT